MELKQYFNIILKRLWLVILLPLVTGVTSAYVSFFMLDKVYEASTTLYVINRSSDSSKALGYNDLYVGEMLVKDYRELIKSRSVTSVVIEQLGLKDITPEGLAGKLNISAKNETRIIEVGVQDTDPEMARNIADKVGEVFIAKAVELMKVDNVNVIDKAKTPLYPVKPRSYINIAIAVFTGLLAAVGIIFLLEYLNDTIKTTEDVEKYMGLPVLATIPKLNIK